MTNKEFDPDWPHGHVTRNGCKARIVCRDVNNKTIGSILALLMIDGKEFPYIYDENGRYGGMATLPDLVNAPEPDKDLGWRNLYNNHDFLGNRWESKELAEIYCGESREGSYLSTHHLVLRSGKIVDVTDESS